MFSQQGAVCLTWLWLKNMRSQSPKYISVQDMGHQDSLTFHEDRAYTSSLFKQRPGRVKTIINLFESLKVI